MKSPLAVGVTAALLIALLTAGGVAALTVGGERTPGEPRLSEQQFETQAATACTRAFTALSEAGADLPEDRAPTDEELIAYNDERQAIFAGMIAELEVLRPPAAADDSADQLLVLVERSAELDDAFIGAYVALPDGQTESPELVAVQAEFQPVVDELRAVASRLGIAACAGG